MQIPESRTRFERPYRDAQPLKSSHLDELVRWPLEASQFVAATVAGHGIGGWGVLHAESLDGSGGKSLRINRGHFEWSRMVVLLPGGRIVILPAGRRDEGVRYLVASDGLSIEAAFSEGVATGVPFASEDAHNWPVGFLGSTPELRNALESLHHAIGATLARLDQTLNTYRPWLAGAQQLTPPTPVPAAMPWLGALAQAVNDDSANTAQQGWPPHPTLLKLLTNLAAKLPSLQSTDEVDLKFISPPEKFNGRSRRRYCKKPGIALEIMDPPGRNLAMAWAVAPIINRQEQDMRPTREVNGEWTEFVVGFTEQVSPDTRLSFCNPQRRDREYGPV